MVIGFFELRLIGLTRFPLWLTPELLSKDKCLEIVLFYEEDDLDDKQKVLEMYPKGTKLIKVEAINKRTITKLLVENRVERLVVMAQRIPDTCFVTVAKSVGIKTVMYQHGLYIPFMKREKSLFVKNLVKTFRFLSYALTTAKVLNISRLKIILSYYKIYILGIKPLRSGIPIPGVNVDKVMVYGDYWKEYHSEEYGYTELQQCTVGTPDFNDLNTILSSVTDSYDVCYVAQTLVEDGRLSREVMSKFILHLAHVTKLLNVKLFIRLHPRSDMSLYAPLEGVATFSKDIFPKSTIYLGHYSSILAKATFFSDKIILVDFPEHQIPKYIDMLKYRRFDYLEKKALLDSMQLGLTEGILDERLSKNVAKQDKFFDSSFKEPFSSAATQILD